MWRLLLTANLAAVAHEVVYFGTVVSRSSLPIGMRHPEHPRGIDRVGPHSIAAHAFIKISTYAVTLEKQKKKEKGEKGCTRGNGKVCDDIAKGFHTRSILIPPTPHPHKENHAASSGKKKKKEKEKNFLADLLFSWS